MILMTKKSILYALLLLCAVSCSKEDEPQDPPMPSASDIRVVVANEGQFGAGTASLTAIMYNGFVKNDIFRTTNSRPLGDVAQSITQIDNHLYVTLNNSRKIEVMEFPSFKSVETIPTSEATIPTYIAHLGGDSIAVGEKGSEGRLMIVDINHKDASRKTMRRVIDGVGSTNQMKLVKDKLFLAGYTLRVMTLKHMNAESMRTLKDNSGEDISVVGDSKIVLDKNNKLWVLCYDKLICIDPETESVVKEYPFSDISIDMWGGRLDISPDGQKLYFTGSLNKKGGILKMNITDNEAPKELLFEHSIVRTLYNMSVSPEETIFICDVQYGSLARCFVHEYSLDGKVLNTFEAGIFAQYIHFPYKKN